MCESTRTKEKRNPLISIIVPIYNREKYLEKCIKSILQQTYKNLEIILINDGSVDKSGEICEKYAKMDERIRYYSRENKGVMYTRKEGIAKATGSYIGFVDSDDWIEPDMYAFYVDIVNQYDCDLVTSGYEIIFEDGRGSKVVTDTFDEGIYYHLEESIYPKMIHNFETSSRGIDCTLASRLMKKEILVKACENLDDRIFYGDDALIYAYCLLSQSIYISHKTFYKYFKHNNSICWNVNPHMHINNQLVFDFLVSKIKGSAIYEELLIQIKRYMLDLEIHNLQYLYGINIKSFAKWEIPIDEKVLKARVVIYGAGFCGQAIYRKVCKEYQGTVVDWVDANYQNKQRECGYEIKSPEVLCNREDFDYVIVAVDSEKLANEIIQNCREKYHISSDKIIWKNYKCEFCLL